MELRQWCNERLAAIELSMSDSAGAFPAMIVTELKHRAYAAGLFDFALSLPIEAEKYPISAACQLRKALLLIDSPKESTGGPLTVKAVADQLGVAVETVSDWIKSGQLKASNVGKGTKRGRYRIQESDLEEFLENRQPAKPAKRQPAPVASVFRRYT